MTGLAAGQQVTLLNNGADALTVGANGTFTFATPVASGGGYMVSVGTQPIGQVCTVAQGSGAGVNANVSNVSVICSTTTYSLSGTVTGLAAGQQVTLLNNGADAQTVTANGAFTFATPTAFGGSYMVSVGTQPTGQVCTVTQGAGSGVAAPIADIAVTCVPAYTVTVTVGGVLSGGPLVLQNGTDILTVLALGTYAFPTPVAQGGNYNVSVVTQPTSRNQCYGTYAYPSAGTNVQADVLVTLSCILISN